MHKKDLLNNIDFYLVTDPGLSTHGSLSDVRKAIEAGCRIVQYREKSMGTKEMVEEATLLKEICGEKAIFIINDRIDIALAVDADGVHIGQDDMPIGIARQLLGDGKIIGLSVHDVREALDAEMAGADYVGLGPIFDTSTKKDAGEGIGIEVIREVKQRLKIPVVAIGGINKDNGSKVVRAGADSLVSISAVLCSDDVERETREFIDIIRTNKHLRQGP